MSTTPCIGTICNCGAEPTPPRVTTICLCSDVTLAIAALADCFNIAFFGEVGAGITTPWSLLRLRDFEDTPPPGSSSGTGIAEAAAAAAAAGKPVAA